MYFDQSAYDIRCEWGEQGIAALAPHVDVVIVIDVLSFSTCVDVATDRGAIVYPIGKDRSATDFAAAIGAVVAARRGQPGYSLSPASLTSIRADEKLVLPSLNGSRLTVAAQEASPSAAVLAGCLRNATAVAAAATRLGRRVAVIPAGEHWPGGGIRPALEDWLGAGAVIAHLTGALSPEAAVAKAAYEVACENISEILRGCSSGRELIALGYAIDVDLAARLNVSPCAPWLVDGGFASFDDQMRRENSARLK
jgi:2-phosphosulfolactate phosphatase